MGEVLPKAEDLSGPLIENPEYSKIHAAMHKLWTKNVGQPDYAKSEWTELDNAISLYSGNTRRYLRRALEERDKTKEELSVSQKDMRFYRNVMLIGIVVVMVVAIVVAAMNNSQERKNDELTFRLDECRSGSLERGVGDATKDRCDEDCVAYAKHDTESRKRICARFTEDDQVWHSSACDQPAWLDPKSFKALYQPATVMRPANCLCFAGHWKYPDMGVLW